MSLGPPYLLSFGPTGTHVYTGGTAVSLVPPVFVGVNTAPTAPLFIPVTSDHGGLTIEGGGVTIAAGEINAELRETLEALGYIQ